MYVDVRTEAGKAANKDSNKNGESTESERVETEMEKFLAHIPLSELCIPNEAGYDPLVLTATY